MMFRICWTYAFAATLLAIQAVGAAERPIQVEHFEPVAIRISRESLPPPFQTESASQSPRVVPVPANPVLKVPSGFQIRVFAEVPSARWLALTPEGDVLCAASNENKIVPLRGPFRGAGAGLL